MKKRMAVDTETSGLNPWKGCKPFAVSMCDEEGDTLYWEWPVDPLTRTPLVSGRDRRDIQLIVGDTKIVKDFFNARFDIRMLATIGIEVKGEIGEVSYMARAVNNLEPTYGLKPLSKKYVQVDDADEKELHATVVRCRRIAKKHKWNLAEDVEADYWLPNTLSEHGLIKDSGIDSEVCKEYAVTDAVRTMLLSKFYRHGMKDYGIEQIYEWEMELFPVTQQMEAIGITVDEKRLKELEIICQKKIDDALAVLKKAHKKPVNVNSPKQIVEMLFGGKPLSLPAIHRTKMGQPETGGEALLPHIHNPLVEALLTARANTKALSTFFRKYQELAVREDHGLVLHPGFRQWGTLTERYSCSEPNLQAVSNPETTSSRTAQFVVDVRQVFVPRPDHVWYCPDYSQVEVILFADIAKEPTLLDAIRRKVDIHETTANKVWGGVGNPRTYKRVSELLLVKAEDIDRAKELVNAKKSVTIDYLVHALVEKFDWNIAQLEKALDKKIHRKLAKAVTFTKIFGGGATALMSWINVTQSEANVILNEYDSSFPDMTERMNELMRIGKSQGYVIGPFGNRLTVDRWAPYKIVNHMVQNAAAMLMKRGMRLCSRYLIETGLRARIAMTIHDELIFEFHRKDAFKSVLRKICQLMSDHGGVFSVETPVDIDRVTERWSKKDKVKL